MKLRLSHLLILTLFVLGGCISPPDYPDEPEIEFLSLSRTQVGQQLDTLRVEFRFQDGDGDLGFESYDSSTCNPCDTSCLEHPTQSIYLFDNRTGCLVGFNTPYIPPKGSSDAISGKVSLVIPPICCIPENGFACAPSTTEPFDTVIYSIQMRDRAGHLSNRIDLPPVVISCN